MASLITKTCAVCRKTAEETGSKSLMLCSRCKGRRYCSADCQRADWPTHKTVCQTKWYDKHRKCRDKSLHEGRLELITWTLPGLDVGWANLPLEKAEDGKRLFETEFGGDEDKFFDYWPRGFRWTCCGLEGSKPYGCDHHGTGKEPCTCDFCRMGIPLPDSVWNERVAARHGLKLVRGPDPRSFSRGEAPMTATIRTMMGLPMP
ncbi:hypothetical protein BOTBODRAFT_155631 [Botryobasidium botryosum FD-172 SS1]|uniref:MYND-type domain-containing protein n=1 Tax=Botryobasidium botryosum (strain FD-172 SS1) TaxID=930990 RepID=A0A067N1C1_BOTB1|nr:hypothetical protein BOTBODRAFT_155631 [Botryobasidium botryosum FD-172 SS1]